MPSIIAPNRAQVAAGTGFANGRGRIIAAVNCMDSPMVIYAKDRKWNTYAQLMQNPAYTPTSNEPRPVHMANTAPSRATAGGLIADVERELRRGAFTLGGDLDGGWSWNAAMPATRASVCS